MSGHSLPSLSYAASYARGSCEPTLRPRCAGDKSDRGQAADSTKNASISNMT
jgi:hypothetical protein